MFYGCSALASLDVSSWDTSAVWSMSYMFYGCSALASLDVSGWDTSSVTYMGDMFSGCSTLFSFKVGAKYDTSIDGAVPAATASNGKWWSTKAQKWFTPEQIASERSGVADTYANAEPVSFPDVPSTHWAYKVIMRGVELGLFKGRNDGTFGTNDNIKRCDVAVILWNMASKPAAGSGAKSFDDVKSSAYYYRAVSWASSVGVVSGYSDGTFGPSDDVTREQLAAMLRSYYVKVAGRTAAGSAADFASMPDASKVSIWARSGVGFCFRNRIISGKDGLIAPKATATRAETAKMVVFLYDMLNA